MKRRDFLSALAIEAEGRQVAPAGALSIEHDKFLTEYLKTGNGTQAYLAAYSHVKASTARREASKLLTKPHIAAELASQRSYPVPPRGNGRKTP